MDNIFVFTSLMNSVL